jgi:glycosyltransferase involved in cell wall biosynthesis
MKKYSVVIPFYNEEINVKKVLNELFHELQYLKDFEVIAINDGSTDKTLEILISLIDIYSIRVLSHRRNLGQTISFSHGAKYAKNEYVVFLDGDGQNDPADIKKLIKEITDKDLDLVCGWRKTRKDKKIKKIISRGAYIIRLYLFNETIHDAGCSLKIVKTEVIKKIEINGDMHRFITSILKLRGYKIDEIEVSHRERNGGESKYSWRRIPKSLIDMSLIYFLHKYNYRPLHFFGMLSLISILIGICAGLISLYLFATGSDTLKNFWQMLVILTFLFSINIYLFGLLAEIILASMNNTREKLSSEIQEY